MLAALAVLGATAVTAPAAAQSPEEIKIARQTAGEGLAAYNAGEFDKALKLFEQARALYPSAQILRMIGYSELALEHWMKAVEALEAALDAKVAPLSKEDRKDVQDQMAKALGHIGTVTVVTKTPKAELSIDGGDARPLRLDKPLRLVEGKHKLTVRAPDHLDATEDITVAGGKSAEIPIEPKEKPKPPPVVVAPPPPPPKPKLLFPHQREVGLAAAGAGAALGGAAIITALEALHLRSNVAGDVDRYNGVDRCPQSDPRACAFNAYVINRDADRADRMRDASVGMGIAGGVLLVGGATLVVLSYRKVPAPPPDAAPVAMGPQAAPNPGALRAPAPQASVRCSVPGLGLVCSGAF